MPDTKNEADDAALSAPGEGDRAADRHYRDATQRFIAEGKVPAAAAEAVRALDDDKEREELDRAAEAGRARAKEHDPEARK
jgi:hypothetical protein